MARLPPAKPIWLAMLADFKSPLQTANCFQTHFVGSSFRQPSEWVIQPICDPQSAIRDLALMVGLAGFEPTTPCPPGKCATRLRYSPLCERAGNTDEARPEMAYSFAARLREPLAQRSLPLCPPRSFPFAFIRGFIIFSERIGAARQRRPTGTASSVFCLDVFRHIPREGQTRLGKDRKS